MKKQCAPAGVPLFVKQMAKLAPISPDLPMRQFPAAASLKELSDVD